MRRTASILIPLSTLTAPAMAQSPHTGIYYCTDIAYIPNGVFAVTGEGSFEWKAVQTTDYKTFRENDPSNGPGTFHMEGDLMIIDSGNFRSEYGNPSAKVVTNKSGMELWFANSRGGLINCSDE